MPAFTPTSLPDGLVVAYVVDDEIWLWKQNRAKLLVRQEHIFDPQLSDDGQWLTFRQEHISLRENIHTEELWVIRTDGSELHRLLGPEDLASLAEAGTLLLADDIAWLPGRHELLFNTQELIEGPPGIRPVFDLHLLDLSGHITRLADPGRGGRFFSSPNGLHVAMATDTRIRILDLENQEQRTLLNFERFWLGTEGVPVPNVDWDPQSQFVVTSILPQKLHYPEEYAGEPTRVWRLFVNGQAELLAEIKPFVPVAGITFSPNLQYFFYLQDSCGDAMGMLSVRNLTSEDASALFCVWKLPQWVPDDEHFIYNWDGVWRLGSVFDATGTDRPLDFLNVRTDPDVSVSPHLTWMNDEYFLLRLSSEDICTLNVATLQGVVTEITRTVPDSCPRADFSLPK